MGEEQFDVAVVICTYNRCDMLPEALESLLAQETNGVRYEVILVDNNSLDRTREVVESFIASSHIALRYIFEERQGLSYARNTGIKYARAPIIAFTDDDVRVAKDWVAQIKRALEAHPEVDFVGGKVLPVANGELPAWITPDYHWAPLVLVDQGDEPLYTSREWSWPLVGANFAFRRHVFEHVGLFAPDFQRVKDNIGSLEDHEFQVRLWRAGRRGMYVPGIIVTAPVQYERLTKDYHRRWHTGHGKYSAMMRLKETTGENLRLIEEKRCISLFGVPSFLIREVIGNFRRWLPAMLFRQEALAFAYENELRFLISYIRTYKQMHAAKHR